MSQWHCTAGGNKYGPVELDVLRQWLTEGRVKPTDLVWTEGMADWQQASGVTELQAAIPSGSAGAAGAAAGATAGSATTDPPAGAAAPASTPGAAYSPAPFAGPPAAAGVQPAYYPVSLPNAPGAVAGMVCGIIGVALMCSCVVSLVLGIVAISQSKKAKAAIAMYPGSYGGAGMATAGHVLGIIAIILGILSIIYYIVYFAVMGAAMHGSRF